MNTIVYAGNHQLTYNVPKHYHNSWELIYCTEGSGLIRTADGDLSYTAGEIAIIPPGIQHSNRSDTGFKNYHLNMVDTLLPFDRPTIVQGDANGFLLNAFAAVFYHYTTGSHNFLNPYGELVYIYLSQSRNVEQLSTVVEQIKTNIIHNFQDPNYELNEFLRTFPFSYDYMRKLFKKEIGVTPHHYLNDMRLQTAANLLISETGDTNNISEISRFSGFREPLYFSRVFKQRFGVAPRDYRAHALETASPILDSNAMKILLDDTE